MTTKQSSCGIPSIGCTWLEPRNFVVGCAKELTDLRDQLKADLSATAHQTQDDKPNASELATRIKALKAANTIENAPQRVQRQRRGASHRPHPAASHRGL